MRRIALIAACLFVALTAGARVLMTQEQALASAFSDGKPVRQTFFLKPEQAAAARKESGVAFDDLLVVRYAGPNSFAYFDTHRVRTQPETVMIVVTADGKVDRVEILSFDEPTDYFPKRRWIDQLLGRKLDNELSLNKAIRPISGASLTGQAIVNATRKVLALHHVLGAGTPGVGPASSRPPGVWRSPESVLQIQRDSFPRATTQ